MTFTLSRAAFINRRAPAAWLGASARDLSR
jgi:hypothetical protein